MRCWRSSGTRSSWLLAAFVVASAATACRTTILAKHQAPPPNIFKAPAGGCSVNDYPGATDVPEGSTNLGWIQVPKEASDEETYVKLREAICQKGGDGLSQLHWLEETTKDAPFPFALEANAWKLPDDEMKR
jgi:hypothetical protein